MPNRHQPAGLDLNDHLAHIDRELAAHHQDRQEIHFAPWQVAVAGMSAGTALFAAGGVFAALILKLHV